MKRNISIVFFLLSSISVATHGVNAQWVQSNGPGGGEISCIAASKTDLYAGTPYGVYHFEDQDSLWSKISPNWGDTGIRSLTVSSIGNASTNLFAGTGENLYLSTNSGASWITVGDGVPNKGFQSLLVSDSNLYAGTWGGFFRSTDLGASWTAVDSGLNLVVFALTISDSNLFVGTQAGVFLSTNCGKRWTAENQGLPQSTTINSFAVLGSKIFAGTNRGLYSCSSDGGNWSLADTVLTNIDVNTIILRGTDLIIGTATTQNGILVSKDSGATWSHVDSGLRNRDITSLALKDSILIAGTADGGVYCSSNEGAWWASMNNGMPISTCQCDHLGERYALCGNQRRRRFHFRRPRTNVERDEKWDDLPLRQFIGNEGHYSYCRHEWRRHFSVFEKQQILDSA